MSEFENWIGQKAEILIRLLNGWNPSQQFFLAECHAWLIEVAAESQYGKHQILLRSVLRSFIVN
jgi:hypothetical protein